MWISRKAWELITAELNLRREECREAAARIDRLTEAVARKADCSLTMPTVTREARTLASSGFALEPSSGWYDKKPATGLPIKTGGSKQ